MYRPLQELPPPGHINLEDITVLWDVEDIASDNIEDRWGQNLV